MGMSTNLVRDMNSALQIIKNRLLELKASHKSITYKVPVQWFWPHRKLNKRPQNINPIEFYLERIEHVLTKTDTYSLSKDASPIIYNIFPRYSCTFDHNADKELNGNSEKDQFSEMGTFMKAIAMLPYIKSLGTNIIYLLPITSIGKQGRKGELGSPYAIKNPYKIDEMLAEAVLDIDVETQFRAFVEAAHNLGMKVVLEFVFRTASLDSDWAIDHPEHFYWIKSDIEDRESGKFDPTKYGSPHFSEEEIDQVKLKVEAKDFSDLPEPEDNFKKFFYPTPDKVEIQNGKIIAWSEGVEVKIPSAFADWPPDDKQPPWSDVTYLKLYDHPNYNYIAYNTIRMYADTIIKEGKKNQELWDKIINIIPYYKEQFEIDGVMIDMGHALPNELREEIIKAARKNDPDFILWEENFVLDKKSKEEAYNAVVGYLPFDQHRVEKMKSLLWRFKNEGLIIPMFGTPENHNTPRAMMRHMGKSFSQNSWIMNCLLPVYPFIHSGFELCEEAPINTGLDFTEEEIQKYPSEKLPLFSKADMNWYSNREMTQFIRLLVYIRNKFFDPVEIMNTEDLNIIESENENILSFMRKTKNNEDFLVTLNYSDEPQHCKLEINTEYSVFNDILGGNMYIVKDDILPLRFLPGQAFIGVMDKLG